MSQSHVCALPEGGEDGEWGNLVDNIQKWRRRLAASLGRPSEAQFAKETVGLGSRPSGWKSSPAKPLIPASFGCKMESVFVISYPVSEELQHERCACG